jgi:sRNA-binding regulator protein Hfq
MNRISLTQSLALTPERVGDVGWRIAATGDFNADGKPDIVWQHRTQGYIAVWLMNGTQLIDSVLFSPGRVADPGWEIVGAGDFDGDGRPDLVWRHATDGYIGVWLMNGIALKNSVAFTPERVADPGWKLVAIGDVDNDGHSDLIWQHSVDGYIGAWLMNGVSLIDSLWFTPNRVADTTWKVVGPR